MQNAEASPSDATPLEDVAGPSGAHHTGASPAASPAGRAAADAPASPAHGFAVPITELPHVGDFFLQQFGLPQASGAASPASASRRRGARSATQTMRRVV